MRFLPLQECWRCRAGERVGTTTSFVDERGGTSSGNLPALGEVVSIPRGSSSLNQLNLL